MDPVPSIAAPAPNRRYNSRKWILTLVVISIAIVARYLSWIDGGQLVSMICWSASAYMVGNVGETIAGNINIGSPPK